MNATADTIDFLYNVNTSQLSAVLNNLNPECFGDYAAFVIGSALIISEALPFYKKYCKEKPIVRDVDEDVEPKKEPKENLLQQSDGILHLVMMAAEKFKKK